MKRPMVARAMLAAMTLVIGSVYMPVQVAGLSGDVFAQGVTTWKEVTIYKTVPPGPSDEEVITREQVIVQEVPPVLPSRGPTQVIVQQSPPPLREEVIVTAPAPPPPLRQEVIVTAPTPPPPLRQEVIVAAPSSRHVWVAGYWTWDNGWRWVSGHWELPPQRLTQRQAVWVPGQWVQRGSEWTWRAGHWE